MSTATSSLSNSGYLSASHSSFGPSKKSSSEISKVYKQASQLYLTRRLAEALSVLEPVTNPPVHADGHVNGDDDTQASAPVASASPSHRIKIWSLYITLLNAIVDLEKDEGRREFGIREYDAIVSRVRDGSIWEQVVRDGYGGREGAVDAEVVYNLATLLLGQSPSQALNQSRLETFLSSSDQPNLDFSSSFERSPAGHTNGHVHGTDTPRDLNSRLKILELFTLHVLPRNDEWDYAKAFIANSDILDEERRDAFSHTLEELQDSLDVDDQAEQDTLQQEMDEDVQRQKRDHETRTAIEASHIGQDTSEPNGSPHKRTSSEVDYGIEKSRPTSHPIPSNHTDEGPRPAPQRSPPPAAPPTGRSQLSPPVESAKHRQFRKSTSSPSNDMITHARRLVRALQQLASNMAGALTQNRMILFRAFLFLLAFVMAFSRGEVRARVQRIAGTSWNKIKSTVGMGVKVSYI